MPDWPESSVRIWQDCKTLRQKIALAHSLYTSQLAMSMGERRSERGKCCPVRYLPGAGVERMHALPLTRIQSWNFKKKSMRARHQVGIGLSYRPARLHRLAELMPWNRFVGSINV